MDFNDQADKIKLLCKEYHKLETGIPDKERLKQALVLRKEAFEISEKIGMKINKNHKKRISLLENILQDDKKISKEFEKNNGKRKRETQVFVNNLSEKTTFKDLKSYFKRVKYARVFLNEEKKTKRCGFIELEDEDSVKEALALTGSILHGNSIICKLNEK